MSSELIIKTRENPSDPAAISNQSSISSPTRHRIPQTTVNNHDESFVTSPALNLMENSLPSVSNSDTINLESESTSSLNQKKEEDVKVYRRQIIPSAPSVCFYCQLPSTHTCAKSKCKRKLCDAHLKPRSIIFKYTMICPECKSKQQKLVAFLIFLLILKSIVIIVIVFKFLHDVPSLEEVQKSLNNNTATPN